MNEKILLFNDNYQKYDAWYENHPYLYGSELFLLQQLIPEPGNTVEIGVGTGRFAQSLNIKYGLEPGKNMAELALKRGIKVDCGYAENMPYEDNRFSCALLMVTLCFVDDAVKSLQETFRILKPGARIISGIIDLNSSMGKEYIKKNKNSLFYKKAKFYSADEIINLYKKTGFINIKTMQNIFNNPDDMSSIDIPKHGHGQGLFTVIYADKPN